MRVAPADSGSIYCRHCGYDLRLLPENRCPECGNVFDPTNPRTFRPKPPSRTWPWVRRLVVMLILLGALLASAYGWLWWGWHQEEKCLAAMGDYGKWRSACPVIAKPIGPPWLVDVLGRRAYVLNRVEFLYVFPEHCKDISSLRAFDHIKQLTLNGDVEANSLPVLLRMTELQELSIDSITGPSNSVDAGFLQLASKPTLRRLTVGGVSAEARAKAKAARPDLIIDY